MIAVQDARRQNVKLQLVCLAGNHSVWAAQQLLAEGPKPEHITDFDLRYRKAHVFKGSD